MAISSSKLLGLALVLAPVFSWANEMPVAQPTSLAPKAAPLSNPNEMTKDEWLEKIKTVVPEPICKGFMEEASIASRLKERNFSYENCVTAIPTIASQCQKKYYDSMPAMINQDNAAKWGHTMGECIGEDFAVQYLYGSAGTVQRTKQ